MSEFKRRIIDPVTVPILAAAFIFALVFSFSRILLAIPEKGSTTVALLMAAEILGVCAMLAAVTRLNGSQRAVLVALALALIGGGAGAAEIGVRKIEKIGNEVAIVAKGIKFTTPTVTVPADEEVTIKFVNNDSGVPHNVVITSDAQGFKTVFDPKSTITGVATTAYKVPPLKAAEYFFHCVVHPTMTGELIAGEGGAPAEAAPPPPPAPSASPSTTVAPHESEMPAESASPAAAAPKVADVTAKGFAFEPSSVALRALTLDTIHFQNNDTATEHNIVITKSQGGGTVIFKGKKITGVAHTEYSFTAPAAGKYFFHCEVHPPMTGEVTFK